MRWGHVVSNLITILMSCRKLSRPAVHISFFCWHPPLPPPQKMSPPHPQKKQKTPNKQKTTTKNYRHPIPPKLRISTGRQSVIPLTRMLLSACLMHEAEWQAGNWCWPWAWVACATRVLVLMATPAPKGTSAETWEIPPASVLGPCWHAHLAMFSTGCRSWIQTVLLKLQ